MKTPGGVASKVWQIIRMAFVLIRKGISMKKILLDLSLMMKRRKNKIAGKALRNLIHHHSSAMHGDAAREYEFSCSNTPLYRQYFTTTSKRRNSISMPSGGEIDSTIEAVDRVLERIVRLQNNKDDIDEDFHVDGVEEMMLGSSHDQRVDEAAEEFIKRFYSQLKQQPSTPFLNQEMLENLKM